MKKALAIIAAAICSIFLIVSAIKIGNNIVGRKKAEIKTTQAESYLSEKYHEDKSAFKLIEYRPESYYYTDGGLPWKVKTHQGDSWIYEHNGIEFNVNYILESDYKNTSKYSGHFYDDYQLEQVFDWSTEYLRQNVDKRIIGVSTTNYSLTAYQYYLTQKETKTGDLAITKDEIFDYLNGNSGFHGIYIAIDKNNPNYKIESHNGLSVDNIDGVADKIKKKLPNMEFSFDCENPNYKYEFKRSNQRDTEYLSSAMTYYNH